MQDFENHYFLLRVFSSSVPPFLLFNAVFSNQAPFLFSNGLSAFFPTPSAAWMK